MLPVHEAHACSPSALKTLRAKWYLELLQTPISIGLRSAFAGTGHGAWWGLRKAKQSLEGDRLGLEELSSFKPFPHEKSQRNPGSFIMIVALSVITGMRGLISLFSKHLNSSRIKVLEF